MTTPVESERMFDYTPLLMLLRCSKITRAFSNNLTTHWGLLRTNDNNVYESELFVTHRATGGAAIALLRRLAAASTYVWARILAQ